MCEGRQRHDTVRRVGSDLDALDAAHVVDEGIMALEALHQSTIATPDSHVSLLANTPHGGTHREYARDSALNHAW